MSARPARVALVPGTIALLPERASRIDPIAELRCACLQAAAWLGPSARLVGDEQGKRVGSAVLRAAGVAEVGPAADADPGEAWLVIASGSARRTDKAPGHFDERALDFDRRLGEGLRSGRLSGLDLSMAEELWARAAGIEQAATVLEGCPAVVDYDDDPFGVQYWVLRWELGS